MVVGCHRSKGDPFSNPDRQKALLVAGCVWCQQQTDPCGVTWVLGPQQGHCLVQVLAGTNMVQGQGPHRYTTEGTLQVPPQVYCPSTPGHCTQHCSTLQVTQHKVRVLTGTL